MMNSGRQKPLFTYDFSAGTQGLSGTSGAGYAQKLNNNFQQFSSGIRLTDRGFLCEPATSNNNTVPFDLQISATWTLSQGSFGAVNAKNSVIPGQTAREYVADNTVGAIRNNNTGLFTSGIETVSAMFETTPTTSLNNATTFLQCSLNSSNVLRITYLWATGVITCNGSSSGIIGNVVPYGLGPNGGQLYLFSVSGVPDAPSQGGTRRISVTPGAVSNSAGQSLILHYIQHEALGVATSPVSGSRGAESYTLPVSASDTYHLRYVTDNNQNLDFLNQALTTTITVPTTLYERANANDITGGGAVKTDFRNAYIKRVELWPSNSTNYHIIGDSYVAGYNIVVYAPLYNYRPATWTTDGVAGSSLSQQADRFDATPQYYNDVLIIYDGGLTDDAATAIASINRMIAHLPNKKWIYMESTPNAQAGNEKGTVGYTDYLNKCAAIKAAFPNNYIPTLAIMQANSTGSTADVSNVNNGWWPASLLIDGIVHPNDKASRILAGLIRDAIVARKW